MCVIDSGVLCVAPQYLGGQTPPNIQDKIKQLLYSWKVGLPQEPKIQEAYEMLKREGMLVTESASYRFLSILMSGGYESATFP